MSDERRVIGTVHVDPDAPGVIVRGDSLWVYPVDEDGNPTEATGPGEPLGSGWTEVGFTSEDDEPLIAPAFPHQRLAVLQGLDVDAETMRALFGPAPPRPPEFLMQITTIEPPVDPPYKRRGLTGKAYRSARRRYGRTMRAWYRGKIPGREVVRHFPHVRSTGVAAIPGDPGAVSYGFTTGPEETP